MSDEIKPKELTKNELLMLQYEEDRKERLKEIEERKLKKINRRKRRGNRHPWAIRGSDE